MTTTAAPHRGPDLDATAALHASGLKVTRQRLAVIKALHLHPHATADELVAHTGDDQVSRQAAFLIVADLSRVGLVKRLDVPGQPARYELEQGDNHHHALCSGCGKLVDVPCSGTDVPCIEPPAGLDMQIEVAEVLYRGLCHDCSPDVPTPTRAVGDS